MAHAKIDNLYDDKRKIKRAWRAHPPNPVSVHVMAITYCQRHELDGFIADDWLEELMPVASDRYDVLATLVEESLFDVEPHREGTYRVHGFRYARPSKRATIPARIRRYVLGRDGSICQLCGLEVAFGDVHLDHRLPLARGGDNSAENLQVSHSACNLRKGARR